ncbi:MAG: NUDIX domain-containing protein [Patescibacteria group bacterium]
MAHTFSPIQNHIFARLKNAKSLRYSEIQPKNVPNDLFNYHLQFLVKKEYINRDDDGYSLSESGVKYVADFNPPADPTNRTHLFKVNVLTIISRNNKGKIEILQQLRKSNPSYGKIGVPGGVVRKGESTESAATRKLKIETGLEATFKLLGIQRRTMYVNNELFSDILFPIAYADTYTGELADTEYGHNMWVPIDEAIKNESSDFDSIKSIVTILKAIKNGKILSLPFLYKEDIQNG